ncbi:hypothetical protein [Roseibium aggregatum]|nr:hypothetical protein [Roseibium aggregatum]
MSVSIPLVTPWLDHGIHAGAFLLERLSFEALSRHGLQGPALQ